MASLLAGVSTNDEATDEKKKPPPKKKRQAAAPKSSRPASGPSAQRYSDRLRGDDRIAFHQAMAGVKALERAEDEPRVRPVQAVASDLPALEDDAAQRFESLVSAGIRFDIRRDADRIYAVRAGRPQKEADVLGERGLWVEESIDLHGMTQLEAERMVSRKLRRLQRDGVRRICIVHGKGLHSESGVGVLHDAVVRALTEGGAAPAVRAFATAANDLGGSGALVVELMRR